MRVINVDNDIQSTEMAAITCRSRLTLFCFLSFIVLGMSVLWYLTRGYSTSVLIVSITSNTHTLAPKKPIANWIVVTTVKKPSKDIEKLAKIKGWQLLVVGDSKTPSNWTYPGSLFIGLDEQQNLGFKIAEHLPMNSYTRKVIGYLFAIKHGAKFIYDTDDDNHPTDGKIHFYQQSVMSGLIYDNHTNDVMNPYAHFGQPSIWPRGFPLDMLDKPNNNTYKLCTFRTPAIQQGLVNGDPDVDAIYRLTKKAPHQRYINVTFDARAPPVTLPEGVFAPFNSQNTIFTYNAFWALFLPTSVAFRVTDIWRGYWAQRLLWLIGQRLSFLPPNAVQFRNSHDYLQDFKDESQFYLQTESFVKFLKNWTCAEKTFFKCVSHLGYKMAEASFWEKSDAELLDTWLSDLVSIGYKEPKMNKVKEECLKTKDGEMMHRVFFTPVQQNDQCQTSGLRDLNRFCDDQFNISKLEMSASGQRVYPKKVFADVLMIIVFNFPFYKNIRLLDTIYYDHFPNIVYCGQTPSYAKLIKEIDQGPLPGRQRHITFLNITSAKGYFGYECAIRAMEMGYNVEGYLVCGDDVMFNSWNFEKNINLKQVQMQFQSYRTINRTSEAKGWMWWPSPLGKKPLEKSFDELEILAVKNSDATQKKLISKYLKTRHEANVNMSVVSLSVSDLYYIPKSVSETFIHVMKVFLKNKVFLEIAVPSTMIGLNPKVGKNGFWGKSIWDGGRKTPLKFFNSTTHYVHPVKFSQLFKDNKSRNEYCEKYVMQLLDTW